MEAIATRSGWHGTDATLDGRSPTANGPLFVWVLPPHRHTPLHSGRRSGVGSGPQARGPGDPGSSPPVKR